MEINKEKFARYAELKNKIKELEAEVDMLAPEILEMVFSTDQKKIEADFGTFTMSSRKTYKYTEPTIALAEKLKIAQQEEVATGKATVTESRFITFKAPKKSDE